MNREQPTWKRKIQAVGNASGLTLPKELLEFLAAKQGNHLHIIGKTGKHGRYLAIWNPKQKKRELM